MKRLKPKQRGLAALAILLVATSLAATVTGLVLKAQLQKYVGGLGGPSGHRRAIHAAA